MVAVRCSQVGISVLAILFSTVSISSGAGGQEGRRTKAKWPLVHVPDPVARYAMNEALDKASALLAEPGCGGVLTDFRDQQGKALADRLVAMDVDVPDYLRMITFIDDSRHRHCASGAVAFTEPGGRVVRLCVDRLKEAWARDRTYTVAVVIHELLHTLGLGENPPSSQEITKRVLARCSSDGQSALTDAGEHRDIAADAVRTRVQDPTAVARHVKLRAPERGPRRTRKIERRGHATGAVGEELDA